MLATDVREIAHLDFTPSMPCEMRSHPAQHGNQPAAWVAALACPCGTSARVLVCAVGRARLLCGRAVYVCRCGNTTLDAVTVEWSPINEKGQ